MLFSASMLAQSPKTYTLIAGLQYIDGAAYKKLHNGIVYGTDATAGVALDIGRMQKISEANQHIVTTLFNKKASRENILKAIEDIGKKITTGDYFFFYFSGHGDYIPDVSGDELSHFDQVLVAYNDYVVDDEIYALLNKYFTKTKNVMIVDACHSSTSFKMVKIFLDFKKKTSGQTTLFQNELNDQKQNDFPADCNFGASVPTEEAFDLIYFGATSDEGVAGGDAASGGYLTYWLSQIKEDAEYTHSWDTYTYESLACELSRKLGGWGQQLQFHRIGRHVDNYSFQIPFKIY